MAEVSEHDVRVNGRKRAEVTGVTSVESFDATAFALTTHAGALQIGGTGLHMRHLDLHAGVVIIEGTINSVAYEQTRDRKRPRLRALLR